MELQQQSNNNNSSLNRFWTHILYAHVTADFSLRHALDSCKHSSEASVKTEQKDFTH